MVLPTQKSTKHKLAMYYARQSSNYNPEAKRQEVTLTKELAVALGCRAEVAAPLGFGRIDCLSKDWLIEGKYCGSTAEKNALGQLLCYEFSLKFRGKLGLALIGGGKLCEHTKLFCAQKGITIFYFNEKEQSPRWRLLYWAKL